MIKIVDSGYGIRLLCDEKEVFNHTSLVPFIKSVKSTEKFGVKNGNVFARFDVDGEYALNDAKVVSCSIRSANISFSGYDGDFLKIAVVEEKNRLALHVEDAAFSKAKFSFVTPSALPVSFCKKEIKKGLSDNLVPKRATFFDMMKRTLKSHAEYVSPCSLALPDGREYEFSTSGLSVLDFNKSAVASIYFENVPETIYFYGI